MEYIARLEAQISPDVLAKVREECGATPPVDRDPEGDSQEEEAVEDDILCRERTVSIHQSPVMTASDYDITVDRMSSVGRLSAVPNSSLCSVEADCSLNGA